MSRVQKPQTILVYICVQNVLNFQGCDCETQGTIKAICGRHTGQCLCKDGFAGLRCDKCMKDFYAFPECLGN